MLGGTESISASQVTRFHPVSENELFLLAEIASQYYEQNLTQDQIAKANGLSRSNISRLLKESRERGVVEIKVHHPLRSEYNLQQELIERLGLHDALVLAHSGTSEAPDDKVGLLAARYLHRKLRPGMTIGVGWGKGVQLTVEKMQQEIAFGGEVVQLMGSIVSGGTPDMNGPEIVRKIAGALGATPYYLHTPLIVSDRAVRDSLVNDTYLQKTLSKAREASVMLISVGGVGDTSGVYRAGYISAETLAGYRDSGAVAEICGNYVRKDGSACVFDINERMISVQPDMMRMVPVRIGVSCGLHKSLPNIGAARSGLINVLVTDEMSARLTIQILNQEKISKG